MDGYVIKETSVWGDSYKARTPANIRRLEEKCGIRHARPFIDHSKIYAFKPRGQRGPAKESQTFIVSYPYTYDEPEQEATFIESLTAIGLRFHKEQCVFRGQDAYKILIMDEDVDLDMVLQMLESRTE
jgi:hypothetical protein